MLMKVKRWNTLGETKLSTSCAANYWYVQEISIYDMCNAWQVCNFWILSVEVLPKYLSKAFDYLLC